jgi:hypothetical protein
VDGRERRETLCFGGKLDLLNYQVSTFERYIDLGCVEAGLGVGEMICWEQGSGDALSAGQGGWGKSQLGIPGDIITSCWCDSGRRGRSRDNATGPRRLAETGGNRPQVYALLL